MNTTRTRSTGRRIGNGHVTLYSPTDRRPYYRLAYVDRDGRRCQRSVSRDPVHALTEAKDIDDALSRQHGQAGHRTLGDLAADYTSTARGRMRTPQGRATGRDWQPTQYDDVRRIMRRAVEEVHQVQAWDLDRETINTMRTACGTFGQVQQMTSTVRNFLRWCEEQGALSAEQVALLPAVNATILAPRFPQPEARPARARLSRLQGQSPDFVGEEDCPSRNDVQSLARALQAAASWGELAVHTALLAVIIRGGKLTGASSQTEILNSYVSSLLGRGDPHEDARFGLGETGREAILAGIAAHLATNRIAGLEESAAVSVVRDVQAKFGWDESSIEAVRGLIDRRVLRLDGKVVYFTRNCYLHLFAAKRAAQNSEFKELLLTDPLYYSSPIRAHAALVRTDARVLEAVRDTLESDVDFENASALRLIESVDPPAAVSSASDVSHYDGVGESRSLVEFDDSSDDDDRPAFPSDHPMEMSHAYRLLRALELVSSVLRDSDQVEDLELKRAVLVETLSGWGSLVADLCSDDSFQYFARSLAKDLSAVLLAHDGNERNSDPFEDDMMDLIPSAITLGGLQGNLASRKLLRTFSDAIDDESIESAPSTSLAGIFFAFSVKGKGWPGQIAPLVKLHEKRWIVRHFMLRLFIADYVNDRVHSDDRDDLAELCASIIVHSMKVRTEADRKSEADRQRKNLETRRLGVLTNRALSRTPLEG